MVSSEVGNKPLWDSDRMLSGEQAPPVENKQLVASNVDLIIEGAYTGI